MFASLPVLLRAYFAVSHSSTRLEPMSDAAKHAVRGEEAQLCERRHHCLLLALLICLALAAHLALQVGNSACLAAMGEPQQGGPRPPATFDRRDVCTGRPTRTGETVPLPPSPDAAPSGHRQRGIERENPIGPTRAAAVEQRRSAHNQAELGRRSNAKQCASRAEPGRLPQWVRQRDMQQE